MAIFNVSATNARLFRHASAADALPSIGFDLSTDFRVFDRLESIVYEVRGTSTKQPNGVVTVTGSSIQLVPHALLREVTHREAAASNGQLLVGDLRFEIPVIEFSGTPLEHDKITSNGDRFLVIAVDKSTLKSRWRIYGRRG